MNRTSVILLALSAAAFAGLNLASPVLRLDQARPGEIDLRSYGVLAHVCDGGFGGAISVDLKRLSDDEKFRIAIDPRVRTPGGVVLQQVPPGRYVAFRLLLGDREPVAFSSDTFEIQTGRITSFGKVKVAPETDLLGYMKRLIVKTDSVDISGRIKSFHDFGIDSLPVAPKPVDWKIEPAKNDVGKRFST